MFKFDLAAGSGGRFVPTAEDLELDPDIFSDLEVRILVSRTEGKRRLRIQACATATLQCDRTLRTFTLPITGTHHLELSARGDSVKADAPVEQWIVAPGQDLLDLTGPVRDTLLLAIPARRVAPDAEDCGLQTVFGASANHTEWRWEGLRQL